MRQHRGGMKCALPVGEVGRGPRRGLGLSRDTEEKAVQFCRHLPTFVPSNTIPPRARGHLISIGCNQRKKLTAVVKEFGQSVAITEMKMTIP